MSFHVIVCFITATFTFEFLISESVESAFIDFLLIII